MTKDQEATKISVILPLISALGFDYTRLDEVVPEFIADVGIKKGEKIDFALKIQGQVAILVEVKPISTKLGVDQLSQLFRYFSTTDARLAILTNGRDIWFFSDTDVQNKMDSRPFFTFDLQSFDDSQVAELARFQKSVFDIDAILEAASNIKLVKAAGAYLKAQLGKPDEDFLRLIGRQLFDGSITRSRVEQLRAVVPLALDEVIRDRIQDKLNVAFRADSVEPIKDAPTSLDVEKAETTDDEMQGFMIVRAIGARLVDVDRITIRDAKSYCAILLDDNNRKPICRLHFNSKKSRAVSFFDESKSESRVQISALKDIYGYSELIEQAIKRSL